MLKIKDNVDLKELEEMLLNNGFYYRKDLHNNNILRNYKHFKICKNGHILPLNGGGNDRFDVIYDLIQAGLIEKV